MKKILILVLVACSISVCAHGIQTNLPANRSWAVRMADTYIDRHPGAITYDERSPKKSWDYEQGLMLEAFYRLWQHTGNPKYFDFIKNNIDQYVEPDGNIKTYDFHKYRLDDINTGRMLLALYQATKEKKYKLAADLLRKQLAGQPRTPSGGFWHKKIYPNQMWLDGLYMAEPFYAEYALLFHQPKDFDDIVNQFVLAYQHTLDPKTGLLYHGWDESKQQKWANPVTGDSPNFWSRAMGWYEMALVDVLDYLPKDDPKRKELISILQKTSAAIMKYRDPETDLWYQVTDQGNRKGNYLEASGSLMFAYAFAKGAREGYLDKKYLTYARETFDGAIKNLVKVEQNGYVDLHHTCAGAGLGGHPYRDGSFEYYINEPQRINDKKGVGPFILAAIELTTQSQTVTEARAKQWFQHSEWAHGLKASIHPSVDWREFYIQYHKNKATWDNVYQFLKNTDLIHLAPGEYPIDGKKAYAIISEGPLKNSADSKWEHHEKHIDIQYVIKGEEKIGVAPFSEASVIVPYDPNKDIGFYSEPEKDSHYYIATPQSFFIFFPENAHRPSLSTPTSKSDKKLVIKIVNN